MRNQNKPKKKEPAITVNQAGSIGKKVFNDIVDGIQSLVPVSGSIYVEINLLIEDENLFKDDEKRTSKLIIEIALEKPTDPDVKPIKSVD